MSKETKKSTRNAETGCSVVRGERVSAKALERRRQVIDQTLELRDEIGRLKDFSVSRTVRSLREGKSGA